MRAVSTMISATMVLATAVFSSSATAASLDVEPREPTTAPVTMPTSPAAQDSNSSASNVTSGGKIGPKGWACQGMKYENWDNVKYACSWHHVNFFDYYYTLFFKRYDGTVKSECMCAQGLSTYDPWHPRWTYSEKDHVHCYTRDGRQAWDVKSEFDAYKCK